MCASQLDEVTSTSGSTDDGGHLVATPGRRVAVLKAHKIAAVPVEDLEKPLGKRINWCHSR